MKTQEALAHARTAVLEHLAKEGSGKTFGHLLEACGLSKKQEWHLVSGEGSCPLCGKPIGSNPKCGNCAKVPDVLDAMRGGNPDSMYVHVNERKP